MSIAEYERLLKAYAKKRENDDRHEYRALVLLSTFTMGRLGKNFNLPSFEEAYGYQQKDVLSDEASEANFLKFAQANNLKHNGGKNG